MIELLNQLHKDPFYSKLMKTLTMNDLTLIKIFIEKNGKDSKNEFEYKVNRFFIDMKERPANWKNISEILSVLNSKRS